jgi:endonuclease/exonuclease/phosphatase family metal-dependent hydrolase
MQFLRGDLAFDDDRGDLVDAWSVTRSGDPGPTTPAESPTHRIDYIYDASPTHRTTPRTCRRVLTDPVDGIRASDHVGVLCTFDVASPPRASQ